MVGGVKNPGTIFSVFMLVLVLSLLYLESLDRNLYLFPYNLINLDCCILGFFERIFRVSISVIFDACCQSSIINCISEMA